MKKIHLLYTVASTVLLLASCSDFLDTIPDNRAELDSEAKITSLLVSAYPGNSAVVITEMSTDNAMDNGSLYSPYNQEQEDAYLWKDIVTTGNDSPKYIWDSHYLSIASANQALEAIEALGNPENLNPQRGEALICRAFAHFILGNIFCEAYSPQTAASKLGLPYSMSPETTVMPTYERGTLADFYAKINADIEAALPLINDNVYKVSKYHFNKKAAYAFAARFNLFYVQADKSNFDKVIKYANLVLGSSPQKILRAWEADFSTLTDPDDVGNAYISPTSPANLLIMPTVSSWPYIYGPFSTGQRYGHAKEICDNETSRSPGFWGAAAMIIRNFIWNPQEKMPFPKMAPYFEYTDKVNGIGYLHAVTVPFSTNETLLCRAEASVLKATPDYVAATQDINYWMGSYFPASTPVVVTPERIVEYYSNIAYTPTVLASAAERTVKKKINPQGFEVAEGQQENFIQCILHLRRIETIHEGLRWYDLKRYGIEISHNIEGIAPDVLTVNDKRRAMQLPQDVIVAGLEANPR